ncbi:response regulator [Fibrobacterota bacterium]
MAKLLLLEDEKPLAKIAAKFMTSAGHEVDVVYNGEEGFLKIKGGEPYDLVICDLAMPQWDGFKLMDELKACGIKVKVLIVSAFMGDKRYIERCNQYEFVLDYINKPYKRQVLVDKVAKCLAAPAI